MSVDILGKREARRIPAINRRQALLGGLGLAATAAAVGCGGTASMVPAMVTGMTATPDTASGDTPQQIFTAALIAEDLATTFYYNALIGPVIQDPNLSGSGGTATSINGGNASNVGYIRAALSEEIAHANLLRQLIGGSDVSGDPKQTFYFSADVFTNLSSFLTMLDALENAFIGAYLSAVQEFSQMAADVKAGVTVYKDAGGTAYTSVQLEYFAKVAASILGVEAEHRALGRSINPAASAIPANNLNYEQTVGLTAVYNGSASAVAALTPFLSQGSGTTAYSLATAISGASAVSLATTGNPPK